MYKRHVSLSLDLLVDWNMDDNVVTENLLDIVDLIKWYCEGEKKGIEPYYFGYDLGVTET